MKNCIIIIGIFLTVNSEGQDNCVIPPTMQNDKFILHNFFSDFRDALITKSKHKLSKLIRFPINCDRCMPDSLGKFDEESVKVDRKQFDSIYHKIFFEPKLTDYLNANHCIGDILSGLSEHVNDYFLHNNVYFSFGYTSIEKKELHEQKIEWFTIEKTNGKFKIVSAGSFWLVPKQRTSF